jgi:hypothetical protein
MEVYRMCDSSPATVPVAIRVDRAAAILAGRAAYGTQVVQVDLTSLAQEDRASLADAASEGSLSLGGVSDAIDLTDLGRCFPGEGLPVYPVIPEAGVGAVLSVLALRRMRKSMAADYKAAQAAKADAAWAQQQAEWLAKSDDELIFFMHDRSKSVWVVRPADANGRFEGKVVSCEVRARFDRLSGMARLPTDEARAAEAGRERVRQEKAAKAEEIRGTAAKVRAAKLDDIVVTLCSDEQRRRHAARLLPEEEMLAVYRDHVFGPLASFKRYGRITPAEVSAAGGPEGDGDEIVFETTDAEEAGEGEFATFEAIKGVADKALPPDTSVKLLSHNGGWQASEGWAVSRTSVKVTVEADGVTVSREFAAP